MIIHRSEFPKLLLETPAPPTLLYVEGAVELLASPAIAIVGSRAMTAYGEAVCRTLATQCAQVGLTVASGLATGIDTVAHQAALDAGGQTIAVLGSGLDEQVMFPAANRQLARRIVSTGNTLVSEYPTGTIARRHHFIARNRILAGLCLATIIVEAAERSGAINTVHHALDANRPVFAVPGSIFSSRSVGTNRLIQQGATVLQSIDDVFAELNIPTAKAIQALPERRLTPLQQRIVQCLADQAKHVEVLVQELSVSGEILQASLTDLEIQGIVRKNLWMMYEISYR